MFKSNYIKLLTLFFIVNLFLSSFYIDVWNNDNTTSRILPAVTFLEDNVYNIDKYKDKTGDISYVNGHYYTDKAPLPSILLIPILKGLKFLNIVTSDENGSYLSYKVYVIASFAFGSIPFSLIFVLFIRFAKIARENIWLLMLGIYGSFIFVYSGTFFSHVLTAFILLVTFILYERKKYVLAGFMGGLAFLTEYNIALLFIIWTVFDLVIKKDIKPILYFGLGSFPAIVFIAFYNYIITGNMFDMLYKYCNFDNMDENYGFLYPTIESLWGLSFSVFRGVFIYAPLLFFIILSYFIQNKNKLMKFLYDNYFISIIIYFLFIASYKYWWGGWSYGPRHLIPITVLIFFIGFNKLNINRFIFVLIVFFLGIVPSFISKATVVYSVPTAVKNPFVDLIIPKLLSGKFNENNLLTMLFGVNAGISFMVFSTIFLLVIFLLYIYGNKNPYRK